MKQLVVLLTFLAASFAPARARNGWLPPTIAQEKGTVKGRVTDGAGRGIAGAKVVIEHTQFYAHYVYAVTKADGSYSTAVPAGSWKASVQIERTFNGKKYRFDLQPDNPAPFAGTAGATRNFVWKISGPRPEGGFYGSDLAVYNEPGASLLIENVAVTLTPVDSLANGARGSVVQKNLVDIGGGEDGIRDIPLGAYRVTAKNKATGKPLLIRLRNKGAYQPSLTATFEAGLTGITQYKLVVQVADPEEK